MKYAKEHHIPRVIEIKCPRPSCGQTMYALTDDEKHEHAAWLDHFKSNRYKRHIACKRCGYGLTSDSEGDFIVTTHQISF